MLEYLHSFGVKPGHIVAVQLPTSERFVALMQACIQIGAVFCPLSLRLPSVEPHLKILSPKLFISSTTTSYNVPPSSYSPSSFLVFTSGTTSTPKLVSLTLDDFHASARYAIQLCNLQPNDAWLLSLPLYHVGGLGIIFRCLLSGARIAFDPADPSITHLSYVPTQLYRAWPVYKNLKCILLGGAPIHNIPQELPIIASYGMTETASIILGRKHPPKINGHYYLGHSDKMKLVDGEIWIKNFATKDLGFHDPVEGFAIVGRKDNQFISGGENIQPEEIERALTSHPDVLEAIVVPKNDPEFGQRPVAFVRTLGFVSFHFLQTLLPKYKIPIAFYPLDETVFKPSRKQFFEYVNH